MLPRRRDLLAGAAVLIGSTAARSTPPQAGMTPTFDYLPARDGLALLHRGPRLLSYGGPGIWMPRYSTSTAPKGHGNPPNGEYAFYADPEFPWSNGYSPFALADGSLRIRAERCAPLGFRPGEIPDDPHTNAPYEWVTGVLTSRQRFSQQGGYFEIEAQLPKGPATWPAFWLLPINEVHPPEIDVVEYLGHEPTRYRGTCLFPGPREDQSVFDTGQDLSAGFHRYGMLWTDSAIEFFLDDVQLATKPIRGRPDYAQPFYLLINLAIGSRKAEWVPAPSAATPSPADMLIRRVRAWQRIGPRQIEPANAAVTETAPAGTVVAKVSCLGGDKPVRFALLDDADGRFAIDGDRLRTRGQLSAAGKPRPTVILSATDARGRTWQQPVTVAVLDAGLAANALMDGNSLGGPAWTPFGVRVLADGKGAELLLEQPGDEPHAIDQVTRRTGDRFIIGADLRPHGRAWVKLEVADEQGRNVQAFFDLAKCRVGDQFASPEAAPLVLYDCRIVPVPSGFQRCLLDVGIAAGPVLRVSIKLVTGRSDYGTHPGDPELGVLSRTFIRAVAVRPD